MPTLASNGSQTATINTEHTLYNPTTNKWYSAIVDLTTMVSGDTTVLTVYIMSVSAGSYIQYYQATYAGAQTNPLIYFPPLPTDLGWKLTLKQTTGTGRAYPWRVYSS